MYGFLRLGLVPGEVEGGEVVLGGDISPETQPLYLCLKCNRRFTVYDLPVEVLKAQKSELHTETTRFNRNVEKLHSENPVTVRTALHVFEKFSIREALPEIKARLAKLPEQKSSVFLKRDLIHTLWVIGTDEVVSDLIGFCEGEHTLVKNEALTGLRYLASNGNRIAKKYIEVETRTKKTLSEAVLERVQQDYSSEDWDEIISWLVKYDDIAIERVQMAILDLAEGNKDYVYRAVISADEDYRNILAAHSYYPKKQRDGKK